MTSINSKTLLSTINNPKAMIKTKSKHSANDRFFLVSNTQTDVEEEFHRNHHEVHNQRRREVNNEYFNPEYASVSRRNHKADQGNFGKRMSHGRAGSTRNSEHRRGSSRKGHSRTLSRQRKALKNRSSNSDSVGWDTLKKGKGAKLTGASNRQIYVEKMDSAKGKQHISCFEFWENEYLLYIHRHRPISPMNKLIN